MDRVFDPSAPTQSAEAKALVARLRALGLVLDAVIQSMRKRRERLREFRAAIDIARSDGQRFNE